LAWPCSRAMLLRSSWLPLLWSLTLHFTGNMDILYWLSLSYIIYQYIYISYYHIYIYHIIILSYIFCFTIS
jgi:hypothetical protein